MNPFRRSLQLLCAAALACAALPAQVPLAPGVKQAHPDHHEFEAALWAPFLGEQGEGRTFRVAFGFVDAATGTVGSWRLDLVDAKGRVRRQWHGETFLAGGAGSQSIPWNGLDGQGRPLERGVYTLRLTAKPMAQEAYRVDPGGSQVDRVEAHLASSSEEAATQEATLCVGPAPRLRVRPLGLQTGTAGRRAAVAAPVAPAPDALPYTVYVGNLHSQTNHSDGGVPVGSCTGGEVPQAGVDGPTTAFEMMRVNAGGDFLAATEHNHMYDGSTGTNTGADPAVPKALFASGLTLASSYRAAHPGFVALYGVEWGVISNGGHLNIFNPDGLPTWEYNASNQLLGDVFTAKSDYPALYATMKARGWVGQFNHPSTSQFNNLTYTADGDEVMALCEVSNASAFSTSLTESDTFLSSYEIAYKAILEKGFHVSPTSDQDNHCSNWGLSNRNRTGILVPNGTPWTLTALLDAIRARRTFATQDKGSQLVLTTSGGALMGDRIANSGPLTLQMHYAPSAGRSASLVEFYEGVPGTPFSTVLLVSGTDTATLTPTAGNHYYYAKVTQDDGRMLWSAPIWVNQAAGAVSASITAPSVNTTVLDGATVNFTGSATTTHAAITGHAWDFGDGSPVVTGTATPGHVFNNAGASPVVYTVTYTATDDQGATGSGSRLITVQPAGATNTNPTISDIPNQSTLKDTPVTNLAFSVGDAETNANLLTVAGTSSNQTLLPDANITFGGAGTARTITLTPAPNQTGSATVTVTVTDGAGATASDTFVFTVSAPGGGAPRLIISQYYEGSSNNKFIEITNVGPTTIDLASPQIYLAAYNNAAADDPTIAVPGGTLALTGTLAPGASKVYRNASATIPAYAVASGISASNVTSFNGDDLVILTTSNNTSTNGVAWAARFDVVGDGSTWGADRSYVRKPSVVTPNPTFNLAAEWNLVGTLSGSNITAVDSATSTQTEYLGTHLYTSTASISDIPSQTITANTSTGAIAFTVGGTGTLSLSATTSNAALLPLSNIVFDVVSGTATSRTVTLTPVTDQAGSALVTVTVTDGNGSTASDSLQLTVNDPSSTITSVSVSPSAPTVNGLSTTAFTATVAGTGSYSSVVSWSASGGSIDAAGQWTAPNGGGPYTITATSVQDPAKSGTATVTVVPVNTNPTISDITDKSTTMGTALANIPFTVGDAETPAASLTLGAASTNTALIPVGNITFGGSGANRTVTVTPAAGQSGSSTLTITVSDGNGGTASDTFVVSVVPSLIISQYYEGASFDKWIEVTNVGSSAVNMASPQLYLVLFANAAADNPGSSSPTASLALTGSLAPGASAVYRHGSAVKPTYASGTSSSTVVNFNGDDLVILSTSNSSTAGLAWGARFDVVGDGTTWGQDTSFFRKPTVLAGNAAFNLAGEWIQRTNAQVDAAASDTLSEHVGIHMFGAPPTISDMTDVTATVNTAIPGIPFTVSDAETNPDSLVFTLTSSNTTLLPNAGITVGGTGGSRTLNLAPAAGQLGTATVTVMIRDGGNQVATDTFVLTVNDVAPSALAYGTNPAVYTKGTAIAANNPSNGGGAIVTYTVSPALPAGLSLNPSTGVITGTPTAVAATATYTVTGTNTGGSTTVDLVLTVNDVPPSSLAYGTNPAVYTRGTAIATNTPSASGGAVVSYGVSPALPAGLSLNPTTGAITGTPTAITPTATYTVTATNSGGSASVGLVITVNDVPPSALAYSLNPALYLAGVAIAPNTPSNSGGAITGYTVSPALPAGLVLNGSTGVITGAPSGATTTATYVVTGSNTGGSTTANLVITTVTPVIAAWSGSPQTLVVGANAAPLKARVTYGASIPLAGIPVVFTAPVAGAGGTFASADPVLTDANGVATAPSFIANCTPGAYTVAATIPGGGPSAAFALANVPGAANSLRVEGFPSPLRQGVQGYVTVSVRDLCGNLSQAYTGRVHFTSTDPAATLPADYTFAAWEGGVHTFPVKLNTVGTWSIQVQDVNNGAILGAQSGLTVTATTVTAITLLGPSSGKVGTSVLITGTGFLGASAVTFNGVPATFVTVGSNMISATVPAGATTGKVTVVSPTGTAVSGLNYVVVP
ncbi:MAG: putative Ig domain-containing protein [Holophagaceae bacterium]